MTRERERRQHHRGGTEIGLISNAILFNKTSTVKRHARCPFCANDSLKIDYKDIDLLSKYTSERGRILPSRFAGTCRKHQRQLTGAIKRARLVALLPFAAED